MPSYVLSDAPFNVYWDDVTEWTNPNSIFREVAVDWTDIPEDINGLAEIDLRLSGGKEEWAEVRIWNLTTAKPAGEGPRVQGDHRRIAHKQIIPIEDGQGVQRYVLQIRGSVNALVTARATLVFQHEARFGKD